MWFLFYTKLVKLGGISKEYLAVVYSEDAAVADFAALAGGKQFDVAPTPVKIVLRGDTISEFEDTTLQTSIRVSLLGRLS